MSCVAGIVHGGRVFIGADSGAWFGGEEYVLAPGCSKVFRMGELVLGGAGSLRTIQVMRYEMEAEHEGDPMEWLVRCFVPVLREAMQAHGTAGSGEDGEHHHGAFLVGVGGRLFVVQGDYCVVEVEDGYMAIGAASGIALGVLYATPGMAPEERLHLALNAAAHHTDAARAPFQVLASP